MDEKFDRTMTVDAGVAAFIIKILKPILAEIVVESQRDDIPDLLQQTLHKKRLSIEMIIHIMRGNITTKEKARIDRTTGRLSEGDIEFPNWLVIGDGPNGEEEVWEAHEDEIDDTVEELQSRGYATTKFRIIPETGDQIPVFWPVVDQELEAWIRRDLNSTEYFAKRSEPGSPTERDLALTSSDKGDAWPSR